MNRIRHRLAFLLLLPLLAVSLKAQEPKAAASPTAKDIDPLAMQVLKAVEDPVLAAQAFSFQALIAEEELASNDQIVTFFHTVDVTVQRPDKLHLTFRGKGQRVELYITKSIAAIYTPDSKLYAIVPAKDTIDADLDALRAKGVDMPIGPFLRSNFYDLVAKVVDTAYVIGRVNIFDTEVHQLVFTAADSDWQVWVTGGEAPRFVRAEVVNKKLEEKPRTTIQFLDWNLSPNVSADEFTFNKPADATEINFMPVEGGN